MFEISILENIQFHAKFLRANNGFVRVFNLGDLLDFSRRDTEILLYDTVLETMTQGWDCRDDGLWTSLNSDNLPDQNRTL